MSDEIKQLHNQLRTAQDKYSYFLLAIAASAIAFSIQITKSDVFSYSLSPLGLALIFWISSFYAGCRSIAFVNSTLYANAEYLKVKAGIHPEAGNHPEVIQAASEGIMEAIKSNSNNAGSYGNRQFNHLALGGVFFVTWHILEMAVRSNVIAL